MVMSGVDEILTCMALLQEPSNHAASFPSATVSLAGLLTKLPEGVQSSVSPHQTLAQF